MCKWLIAALCFSDSGTGYKNHPLLLEEGYFLLHSDSGTMSIFPPITEYFGHRNRTPIFKIVARNGLQVFCLEHSRNEFKYSSPLAVGLLTLQVSKMKAVNRNHQG